MQSKRLPGDRRQGCSVGALAGDAERRGPGAGFAIPAMAVVGIAVLVLSCGDGAVEPSPPPPAPVATTVTVNPASAALTALGETARFTGEVRDQNGQVMTGAAVAWASSDASIAAVDASGQVTAAANGSATITATAGSASGTAMVTVAQEISTVAVTPAADTLGLVGDTVRLTAVATDANGHDVTVSEFSWSSSDTLVAVVDGSGLVTAAGNGSATITATRGGVWGTTMVTVAQEVSCIISFEAVGKVVASGAVLFSVSPAGRITPKKRAVTVTAAGCGSLPGGAHLAVALDSELAEWTVMDCETVNAFQVCGEVTPSAPGRTTLTATVGQPPRDSASVDVVMNRVPWRKNRCEPEDQSQLCLLLSLEFDVGETVQLDLDDYMGDEDADSLIYAVDPLNGHSLLRLAEVTFNGPIMSLTGIAEGYASFSITVNDGWDDFGWGLGPVQVGCPGLAEVAGTGTGRIVVKQGETPPRMSECDSLMFDAAVAYWERVLTADDRAVVVTLKDPGDNWISSAWGSGSGPTDAPSGAIGIGRDLGMLTPPYSFYNMARHELAHVLGIGSGREWWSRLRNPFDASDYDNPPDTHFSGELAYRAFLDMGGGDFYEIEGVPVANGRSPFRVQPNTHWQQHVIDTEVMVGCRDHMPEDPPCPDVMPVSTITLAALADMGWVVDMSLAEPGTRIGDWWYP